jgi:hypothetical protein
MAALLRGYEVLHAGAVAIGDSVVGIVGPTGAGKTSLTVHMALSGGHFFTDDVLALELGGDDDDVVLAHPGFGIVNVRSREYSRLDDAAREALGERLGQTGRDKLHYAVDPVESPLPLRVLYFLRPGEGAGTATVRPLTEPEPLRLLTTTFIHEVRAPQHLAQLLDTCARLSASVPMFEVAMGDREDAAALARRLGAHAAEMAIA